MSQKILNTSYKLGNLTLKNRFIMAPMTRVRADPQTNTPNDLMNLYYT